MCKVHSADISDQMHMQYTLSKLCGHVVQPKKELFGMLTSACRTAAFLTYISERETQIVAGLTNPQSTTCSCTHIALWRPPLVVATELMILVTMNRAIYLW